MREPLPHKTLHNSVIGYAESNQAKKEKNDCAVIAIASAFNLSYDRAHDIAKDVFKRKDGKGVTLFDYRLTKLSKDGKRIGRFKIKTLGTPKGNCEWTYTLNYFICRGNTIKERQMTVGRFVEQHPKETYIVTVRGHTFAIRNGVVLGSRHDATKTRRIVFGAWKIGSK